MSSDGRQKALRQCLAAELGDCGERRRDSIGNREEPGGNPNPPLAVRITQARGPRCLSGRRSAAWGDPPGSSRTSRFFGSGPRPVEAKAEHARWNAMLAGALDDTVLCAPDFRERLADDEGCGAEEQDGDGNADDDVRPERVRPRY